MKKDVNDVVSLKTVLTRIKTLHEKISQEQDMAMNMKRQANSDFREQRIIFYRLLKKLGKKILKESRVKSDGSIFVTSNIKGVECRITEKGQIVGKILFDFYPFHLENFVEKNRQDFIKKVAILLKIPKEYIDTRFSMTEEAK